MKGSKLLVSAAPAGLKGSLGIQDLVPPAEARGVVANELLVMEVVVVSTGPEREDAPQAPGKIVSAVSVDGLEETSDDPGVHGEEMEIVREVHPESRGSDGAEAEDHGFDGRRVFSGKTEGSGVVVVKLVNSLIEGAVVKRPVSEVVPGIFEDEENTDLENHLPERGEWYTEVHAEEMRDGVEEPDLREFDGEMAEKDDTSAVSLFP